MRVFRFHGNTFGNIRGNELGYQFNEITHCGIADLNYSWKICQMASEAMRLTALAWGDPAVKYRASQKVCRIELIRVLPLSAPPYSRFVLILRVRRFGQ